MAHTNLINLGINHLQTVFPDYFHPPTFHTTQARARMGADPRDLGLPVLGNPPRAPEPGQLTGGAQLPAWLATRIAAPMPAPASAPAVIGSASLTAPVLPVIPAMQSGLPQGQLVNTNATGEDDSGLREEEADAGEDVDQEGEEDEDDEQEGAGSSTYITVDLQRLYSNERLNNSRINIIRAVMHDSYIHDFLGTKHILPGGIDLTTAELLAFFPGVVKDPLFIYRCISVGWTSPLLRYTIKQHITWNNDDIVPRQVRSGLEYVLEKKGVSPPDYNKKVDVAARTKLTDYTCMGLSIPYQLRYTDNVYMDDPTLSQLRTNVNRVPRGQDAGTLTDLVIRQRDGRLGGGKLDLHMSEVADHLSQQPSIARIAHIAAQDEARCAYWAHRRGTRAQ